MRNLLIAAALGVGLLSTGAATQQASAAPFNAGGVEVSGGIVPVQYYRGGYYRRPYYAPPPPPRYYAPRPRYYGYYAPPPPRPRYYAPRPYYRHW